MSDLYLIEKKGWYYRPNALGYTGIKAEAGRYCLEEATARCQRNDRDGPRMVPEGEAPEFSSNCPIEERVRWQSENHARELEALRREIADLRIQHRRSMDKIVGAASIALQQFKDYRNIAPIAIERLRQAIKENAR